MHQKGQGRGISIRRGRRGWGISSRRGRRGGGYPVELHLWFLESLITNTVINNVHKLLLNYFFPKKSFYHFVWVINIIQFLMILSIFNIQYLPALLTNLDKQLDVKGNGTGVCQVGFVICIDNCRMGTFLFSQF